MIRHLNSIYLAENPKYRSARVSIPWEGLSVHLHMETTDTHNGRSNRRGSFHVTTKPAELLLQCEVPKKHCHVPHPTCYSGYLTGFEWGLTFTQFVCEDSQLSRSWYLWKRLSTFRLSRGSASWMRGETSSRPPPSPVAYDNLFYVQSFSLDCPSLSQH